MLLDMKDSILQQQYSSVNDTTIKNNVCIDINKTNNIYNNNSGSI